MRNSVAHGGLRFESDSKDPAKVTITFTDRHPYTRAITLRGTIHAQELRAFVFLLIADLENQIE